MVFGAISRLGKSEELIFKQNNKNLDSNEYQRILENSLIPMVKKLFKYGLRA